MKRILLAMAMLANFAVADTVTDSEMKTTIYRDVFAEISTGALFLCEIGYKLQPDKFHDFQRLLITKENYDWARVGYLPLPLSEQEGTDLIITPGTQPVITVKNYFRSVLNKDAREMKEGDSGSSIQFTTTPDFKHVTKIGISNYAVKSVNVGTLIEPKRELRAVEDPMIECSRP